MQIQAAFPRHVRTHPCLRSIYMYTYMFKRFTSYIIVAQEQTKGKCQGSRRRRELEYETEREETGAQKRDRRRIQRRACNGRIRRYIKVRYIEVYNRPSKLHLLPLSVKIGSGTRIPGLLQPPFRSLPSLISVLRPRRPPAPH